MTLAELAGSKRLTGQCDKTTVFRLLQRLTEHGMVRRLGLHERAAYSTLLAPVEHSDYLNEVNAFGLKIFTKWIALTLVASI